MTNFTSLDRAFARPDYTSDRKRLKARSRIRKLALNHFYERAYNLLLDLETETEPDDLMDEDEELELILEAQKERKRHFAELRSTMNTITRLEQLDD